MFAHAILFLATLRACSSHAVGGTPSLTQPRLTCNWSDYATHSNVTSWEFQMRTQDEGAKTRREWECIVEDALQLVEQHIPEFRFDRASRRTMVLREAERRVSTDDGRPLDPKAEAKGVVLPWEQIGVLRLRLCLATEAPPSSHHPCHLLNPGQADLALKVKGVNPATFPPFLDLDFPSKVHGARLAAKLEDDVHCTYQRASYSATFERGRGLHAGAIKRLKGVQRYFPGLAEYLHLRPGQKLPLVFDHYMSKTYWDASFGGVPGTAQLYVNYTSEAAAVTGSVGYHWELSLRVRRVDAEAGGGEVARPLQLIAAMCDFLGQHGWTAMPREDMSAEGQLAGSAVAPEQLARGSAAGGPAAGAQY